MIKSISSGAAYVTPDSKIYREKSQNVLVYLRKLVFLHKIRAACLAGKEETAINWTWLQLSISDWSIIMIGPGGLLLVVPA